MEKNVAGQRWIVFAYQDEGGSNPGEPVTGDAANITANLRIDGGAANAVDDTNPTELEDGFYYFDITQVESNGDLLLICPVSSTANVNVVGAPAAIYTSPPNYNALGIESDGDLTKVNTLNGHTAQTGDNYARLGAPAGADIAADIAANATLVAALNDISVADILTTQMTESYNADGVAPTLAQALFGILQGLTEFAISGTTLTVKQLDGSTTAYQLTLNDSSNPTSVTRTS